MLILLIACTKPGDLTGRLVDARTDQGIGPAQVVATAPDADEMCRVRQATTDNDGDFRLTGLCPGERYAITPRDPTWWAPEPPTAAGDVATTGVVIAAWRAPTEDGAWLLLDDHLEPLPPNTRLDVLPLTDGAEPIPVPLEVPLAPPTVAGEAALVLVGARLVEALVIAPLVAFGPRTMGPPEAPRGIHPWYSVGVRLTPEGGTEPAETPVVPKGRREVSSATRQIAYLDEQAVPRGTYVLHLPGDRDAWILTFGPPSP